MELQLWTNAINSLVLTTIYDKIWTSVCPTFGPCLGFLWTEKYRASIMKCVSFFSRAFHMYVTSSLALFIVISFLFLSCPAISFIAYLALFLYYFIACWETQYMQEWELCNIWAELMHEYQNNTYTHNTLNTLSLAIHAQCFEFRVSRYFNEYSDVFISIKFQLYWFSFVKFYLENYKPQL